MEKQPTVAVRGSPSRVSVQMEAIAKATLSAAALCYAAGLLLSNIFQGLLGFTDLGLLRPRYVLVGIAFGIYVAVPYAIVLLPGLLLAGSSPRLRWPFRAGLWAFFSIILAYLFSLGLQNFVVSNHSSSAWNKSYWLLYNNGWILVPVCIGFIAVGLYRLADWTALAEHVNMYRRAAIGLGLVSALSLIIPYAAFIYPQIEYSIGGGQPTIVTLALRKDVASELEELGWLRDSTAKNGRIRLIMWSRGDEYSYVSTLPGKFPPSIVVLHNSDIVAMEILNIDFIWHPW